MKQHNTAITDQTTIPTPSHEPTNSLTRQFKIYERRHHFGAGLRMRVARNGLRCQAIEGAAEGAGPRPLFELAVGVEVSPAVLAPGEEIPVGSEPGRLAVLVLGRERRDGDAPREA